MLQQITWQLNIIKMEKLLIAFRESEELAHKSQKRYQIF